MSDLPLELLANPRVRVVETPPPILVMPPYSESPAPPPPSQEHVAAVDGAFLRQRQEQETIANLVGLRLSILLMHDLAKDATPTVEEEPPAKQKPEGEDEPAAGD
ncbi:MAG TPA: hypothetical protein VMS17_12540 [Gemmataceae bacterium]|nr:hypothetical protein [Gemmataceae bacterium]